MKEVINEAKEILSKRDRQIAKIIRLTKYKFGWGRKAIFQFTIRHIAGLENRISPDVKKNFNTSRMFAAMSKEEKSHLIQILEKIERRNECKRVQ